MGPKTFVACYVCLKEFGSRSIPLHEPKCLERWRASNRSLPVEKRTATPVKKDLPWKCSHCQISSDSAGKTVLASSCSCEKSAPFLKYNNGRLLKIAMTGVVKTDFSPKKGKENKNISNHIPVPSTLRKNAKNEAKADATPKKEKVDGSCESITKKHPTEKCNKVEENEPQNESKEEDSSSSTSNRSVRPQTKILRRPTPNLKHPVIQVDSDDSGGDSCSSDKSKDDNPKRLKMGNENPDSSHKRKNFIMYNKYNVDKNTKNAVKDRTSASLAAAIPNPCNSCSRSQAPERLHSHARKDARGLMNRRSPAMDIKMASPQKKPLDSVVRDRTKSKDVKSSPSLAAVCIKEETQNSTSPPVVQTERKELDNDICATVGDPESPIKDFIEPLKACYICQEEFKVSALLVHESKCLETWKKTNNSLTPNLRQLPPRRPEENCPLTCSPASDEDDPAWSAVQSQLIPCPLCSRTFFPERMPVHRRVCKGKQSPRPLKRASSLREQSASSTEGEESKPAPLYLPCYVCNRNYGSWVLPMHEQQCLKKWRKENEKLANEERQEEPRKTTDDDVASLAELGDNAWESHLQQLVPCPRCSRTFFPDRLEIHQRSCKGPSCNRRPRSNKGI